MSELKCPFCGEKLYENKPNLYDCRKVCCNKTTFMNGTKELWQELIRTREALGIAVRAIKTIKYSKKSDAINLRHKANKALIEIYKIKDQTALEQKDK